MMRHDKRKKNFFNLIGIGINRDAGIQMIEYFSAADDNMVL